MSDFAAGCPGCKQHLEEIATLEAHIKQLEAKCDSLHKGKDRCMLKPEHKGVVFLAVLCLGIVIGQCVLRARPKPLRRPSPARVHGKVRSVRSSCPCGDASEHSRVEASAGASRCGVYSA